MNITPFRKIARMSDILEKLKKYESENSMLSDIISELEQKIHLGETSLEQDKEIEKMIDKEKIEISNINSEEKTQEYHYATYNKYQDEEPESEYPRMTVKWINKFLCSNYKLYYRTHELNECLYFHFKGFRQIENLETFTNLKVLYLEGNAIKKIAGFEKLTNLMSLYLHQNLIEKIEGLDSLKLLSNLNLSENCISVVENLGNLPQLTNLQLKHNRIGIHGLEDLFGLRELKSISVVDLSENRIEEPEVKEILQDLTTMRVLYLQGNGCVRKIPHYRKTLINSFKDLRYLDDKPVFEDERRFAEAFGRGGLEAEKREREVYRKEKQDAEIQRVKDFREMVDKWRGVEKTDGGNENLERVDSETQLKEKEDQRRKLLEKLQKKSNSSKMEIKEETIDLSKIEPIDKENVNSINLNPNTHMKKNTEIFDDNYDLPDLETVKNKKQEGYLEYVLEKEKYNLEMNEELVDTTRLDRNDMITQSQILREVHKTSQASDNFDELD